MTGSPAQGPAQGRFTAAAAFLGDCLCVTTWIFPGPGSSSSAFTWAQPPGPGRRMNVFVHLDARSPTSQINACLNRCRLRLLTETLCHVLTNVPGTRGTSLPSQQEDCRSQPARCPLEGSQEERVPMTLSNAPPTRRHAHGAKERTPPFWI